VAVRKDPWKKANPKKPTGTARKLSPAAKAGARRAASKAGRKYPNLVDNMRAARKSKTKRPSGGRTKKAKGAQT
jgi:hypothetical protein